jgi:hypothetical protein
MRTAELDAPAAPPVTTRIAWLGLFGALACTPNRPPLPVDESEPAHEPAPQDMSPAPGPGAPVPEASSPAPAASNVQLAADAGLRVVLDLPAWDVLAAPGRVVTVEPDLLHLAARDPATGAVQWTSKVQPDSNGWHTLFGLGDSIILLAGPRRIHVDAATGTVRGTRQGFFHGADKGCSLDLSADGRSADWSTWIPATPATATCAQSCGCSLFVFDCSGASDRGASFHSQTTHLYHSLREPHDTVCFDEPGVLARGADRIVVRAQDDTGKPLVAGLDATTFKTVWTRPEYATLSRHGSSGADPSGSHCWIADDTELLVFQCSTGIRRYKTVHGGKGEDPGTATVAWPPGGALVQHRDSRRTLIQLRDAGGERRWERTLPAGQHAVLPTTVLDSIGGPAITTHVLLDPATAATIARIPIADKQRLVRTSDGYARLGPNGYAEFDARGQPLRESPRSSEWFVRVTPGHIVERSAEQLRVLRRGTLAPVLTLAGSWSLRTSEALGPDALVLFEHRGEKTPRVLVLRP